MATCLAYLLSDIALISLLPALRLENTSDYAIRYFTILFGCIASVSGAKGIKGLFNLAEQKAKEVSGAKRVLEDTFSQIQETVAVLNVNTAHFEV